MLVELIRPRDMVISGRGVQPCWQVRSLSGAKKSRRYIEVYELQNFYDLIGVLAPEQRAKFRA